MKGISLPLETVVLLILAAVVLAALLGFFMGTFTPSQSETEAVRAQINVCQEIANAPGGCKSLDAETISQARLVNVLCKPDRPACSPTGTGGSPASRCIASCCRAFCPP